MVKWPIKVPIVNISKTKKDIIILITYIFEQLSLILKIYLTLDNILSISFDPRIMFKFLWALSLFLYASKHSASNHGQMKSDFMEMDGVYLSTTDKRVCLKASQASSGSIKSRIASQCMLPNSLFNSCLSGLRG